MLYSSHALQSILKQTHQKGRPLPVVVRAKYSTLQPHWPDKRKKFPVSTFTERHIENRALLESFIAAHSYALAWENSFFEILTSPAHGAGVATAN